MDEEREDLSASDDHGSAEKHINQQSENVADTSSHSQEKGKSNKFTTYLLLCAVIGFFISPVISGICLMILIGTFLSNIEGKKPSLFGLYPGMSFDELYKLSREKKLGSYRV
jgi:hypothetical protein